MYTIYNGTNKKVLVETTDIKTIQYWKDYFNIRGWTVEEHGNTTIIYQKLKKNEN